MERIINGKKHDRLGEGTAVPSDSILIVNEMQKSESGGDISTFDKAIRDFSAFKTQQLEVSLMTQRELKFLESFKKIIDLLFLNDDYTNMQIDDERIGEMNEKLLIIEEIIETSIGHVRGGRVALQNLVHSFPEWNLHHNDRIEQLKNIAISESVTAKLAGFTTSLVGGLNGATICSVLCDFIFPANPRIKTEVAGDFHKNLLSIRSNLTYNLQKAKKIIEEDRKYFQDMYNFQEHVAKLEDTLSEFLKMDMVEKVFENVKGFVEKGLKIVNDDERLKYIEENLNDIIKFISEKVSQVVPKIVIAAIILHLVTIILLMLNKENQIMFPWVLQSRNNVPASSSDSDAVETGDLRTVDTIDLKSIGISEDSVSSLTKGIHEAIKKLEQEAQNFQIFYESIIKSQFNFYAV